MNSDPLSQSMPVTRNGTVSMNASNAARMWVWALLRMRWV